MAKDAPASKETVSEEENPSMEDILQSIRGVIAGEEDEENNDDVLELTEMAEENQPESKEAVTEEAKTDNVDDGSVLDDIDKALEDDGEMDMAAALEEQMAAEEAGKSDNASKDMDMAAALEEQMAAEEAGKSDDAGEDMDMAAALEEQMAAEEAGQSGDSSEETLEATPAEEETLEASPTAAEPEKTAEKSTKERLVNDPTAQSSTESLKSLVDSIPRKAVESMATRSGTTVEDLVVEAIRPILADWLNENLSTIVKQLVEKEIKRLIPHEEDE